MVVERSFLYTYPCYGHLYMNIVPVNFSTKHRAMLGNVKKWIDKGRVAIDPDLFDELQN
jgi:hypothetical protein